MGKSLQSAGRLQELSRIVSSVKAQRAKQTQQPRSATSAKTGGSSTVKVESPKKKKKKESLFGREREQCCRTPLATVVADCAKRWFHETLKEAKAGDPAMQVLLGQMYHSGYGVPRDPKKGHAWISKVSRVRSSVWKVSEKHPGYRASDSDSCEAENKAKSYR